MQEKEEPTHIPLKIDKKKWRIDHTRQTITQFGNGQNPLFVIRRQRQERIQSILEQTKRQMKQGIEEFPGQEEEVQEEPEDVLNLEPIQKKPQIIVNNQNIQNVDVNVNHLNNNFIAEEIMIKQTQSQKIKQPKIQEKRLPKIIVVFSLLLSFYIIGLLISYLIYNLTEGIQNHSHPKLKGSKTQQLIINRTFEVGKVYYNRYLITTESNKSTITINYTMIIGVQECQEQETKFVAVLQKRQEELYDQNGTFIKRVKFDQSDVYLRLLKYGKDYVAQPIDPNVNRTVLNQSSIDSSELTSPNTSFVKQQQILQVFRFGLKKNGKITNFTFPNKMEKTTLGLLRSFVKMFSPFLTKDIYIDSREIQMVKRDNPMKRLLQQFNLTQQNSSNTSSNNTEQQSNSINLTDSVYSEKEKHNFETDDESITLQKTSSVNFTGPTHNSEDQSNQSNHFSDSGQLKQATLQSNTLFKSVKKPPNQNYSVINFDIQQKSHQKAEMNLLESFTTKIDYIKQFESLIVLYEDKNETLTFTVQGMMNYILGGIQQKQPPRLLLEQDGSLKIISYDKKINILGTNVVGFEIGALGYLQLKISLYQDPKDSNKKIPKIIAGVGTILALGFYKTKVPVLDYTKQLPPLTLKFTLDKIEGVVKLFKGNFIGKVIQLSKILLSGDFEGNLVPNIMKVLDMVSDVDRAVRAEQQSNSPVSIIIKILSSISDIRAIVDSKGMELLNPQNQFAQSLTGELMSYYNISFAEALIVFNAVKGNLSLIKNDGTNYLQNLLTSFVSTQIAEVAQQIRTLIPPDVWEDYQKQIEKAKAIIQFFTFVRDRGLEYASYMQSALNQHNTNLIGLVKRVVDLYFRNQTNITDTFVSKVTGRFNIVKNQLQQFKNMKEIVNVTQMTNRVQQLFSQILFPDFLNGYFNNQWRNQFNNLQSLANGVSSEKGDCCEWKTRRFLGIKIKKICRRTNPAINDQASEPSYFSVFKSQTQSIFNSIVNQIQSSLESMKNILQDPNYTIVQKFYQLKPRIEQLQTMVPQDRIKDLINKIQDRINKIKNIRSRIGCGGRGNINGYIVNLENLYNFVGGMRNRFNLLKNTGGYIVNQFNQTVYNAILDNTVVLDSVTDFFSIYKNYEDSSLEFFDKIKQIALTYDPKEFAKSTKIATDVFRLYGTITKSLNELCINKDDNKTSIDLLRQSYKQRLNGISNLSNDFLAGELSRLRYFLGNGSTNLYDTYLSTSFCEIKKQFQNDIAILFPDFQNFTLIFELYVRMEQIQNYTTNALNDMKSEARGLSRRFFKLFTADGYKDFIRKTKKLADSFTSLVDNLSMELSHLREEAKTIYMFGMASENQITHCLQVFANSSFVLSSLDTFQNLSAMVAESILVVQKLSFDVIAFVVAAKDVLQYLEDTVSNFQSGTQKIMNSFKSLCQSFLDVSALVNQQYLNNINRDFRNIINVMNDTIFPKTIQNLNAIVVKFQDYKFRNQYLKQLFKKSMVKLLQYGEIIQNCKIKVYNKLKQFTDLAISLIQKLEIGSLNSIFELSGVIQSEFSNFFNSFPGMVRELLDFKSIVDKDFRRIFKFMDFFNNIKTKIEERYERSIQRITNQINQTERYLKQNSKFYNKFKDSSVFRNVMKAKQKFVIKFQNLWGSARGDLIKIQDFLKQITGSVAQILKQLNQAKQKVSKIGKNVEQRIKNIKNHYQQIRKKLFNIKSLFFISLKGDLSKTVMEALRKIATEVDNIIDIDLASVNELANSTLKGKVRLIAQLIEKTKIGYDILRKHRQTFFLHIEKGVNKIDEFIQDTIVSKFQKLKDGILYIKSKTDLENPTQRMVLYEKTIASKRAPIFSFSQPIPTMIGTFMISINIQYMIGAKVFIALRQFRSIDLGVTFQAALLLQINFSYGICYILEFGFYVRGSVLRGQITPALKFNGIIPIFLVQAISDMQQINKQNKASIQFVIDLQIYAVEVQIGFYIKHIWLQILWLDLQLCFNFWFFKFCIKFKIPYGFKIIWKRHDWGFKVPGIPIVKTTILRVTIIKWKY